MHRSPNPFGDNESRRKPHRERLLQQPASGGGRLKCHCNEIDVPVTEQLELRGLSVPGKMETHSRSLEKAISGRVAGTPDPMIISWVVSRNLKLVAAIGFTEIVTKSLLYYLHERVWLHVPFGRQTQGEICRLKFGSPIVWLTRRNSA